MTSKKIRAEQEKDLKGFRESLKQEVKLLKHEVELLPKDRRKEELKARKERLDQEHQLRVRKARNSIMILLAVNNYMFVNVHSVPVHAYCTCDNDKRSKRGSDSDIKLLMTLKSISYFNTISTMAATR